VPRTVRAEGAPTLPLAPAVRAELAATKRTLTSARALTPTPEVSALIRRVVAQRERLRWLLRQAKRIDAAQLQPHRLVSRRRRAIPRRPACRRRLPRQRQRRSSPPPDEDGDGGADAGVDR
jgi:hypothetical protein